MSRDYHLIASRGLPDCNRCPPGPLEILSRSALRHIVASADFARDGETFDQLRRGGGAPVDDSLADSLFHDAQLGLWLRRMPRLHLVQLPRHHAWADTWRIATRGGASAASLLMVHKPPWGSLASLAAQTERLWSSNGSKLVHTFTCVGAPCASEHCAHDPSQRACAADVRLVDATSGAPLDRDCKGCRCRGGNGQRRRPPPSVSPTTGASQVETGPDASSAGCPHQFESLAGQFDGRQFDHRVPPRLPRQCWHGHGQREGGRQLTSRLSVEGAAVEREGAKSTSVSTRRQTDTATEPRGSSQVWAAPYSALPQSIPLPLAACLAANGTSDEAHGLEHAAHADRALALAGMASGSAVQGVAASGYCAPTDEDFAGDCTRGESGSWRVGKALGIHSLADCIARCLCCARCHAVSYSAAPAHRDCSWYASCPAVHAPPRTGADYLTVHIAKETPHGYVIVQRPSHRPRAKEAQYGNEEGSRAAGAYQALPYMAFASAVDARTTGAVGLRILGRLWGLDAPSRAAQVIAARVSSASMRKPRIWPSMAVLYGSVSHTGAALGGDAAAPSTTSTAPDAFRVLLLPPRRSFTSQPAHTPQLANAAELAAACPTMAIPSLPTGTQLVCQLRALGTGATLAADVRAAQEADVLVGAHGAAAFVYALFMRPGSAALEVRPFKLQGLEPGSDHSRSHPSAHAHPSGPWSDNVLDVLGARRGGSIRGYAIVADADGTDGVRQLVDDGASVRAWDTHGRAVSCSTSSLREALQRIIHRRGERPHDSQRVVHASSTPTDVSMHREAFRRLRVTTATERREFSGATFVASLAGSAADTVHTDHVHSDGVRSSSALLSIATVDADADAHVTAPATSDATRGPAAWQPITAKLPHRFARRLLQRLLDAGGPLPSVVSEARVLASMALADHVVRHGPPGDIVETGVFARDVNVHGPSAVHGTVHGSPVHGSPVHCSSVHGPSAEPRARAYSGAQDCDMRVPSPGVYMGGTTIAILAVLGMRNAPSTHLHAADSFQGLPAAVSADSSCADRVVNGLTSNECVRYKRAGDFAVSRAQVERHIERYGVQRQRLRVVGMRRCTRPCARACMSLA